MIPLYTWKTEWYEVWCDDDGKFYGQGSDDGVALHESGAGEDGGETENDVLHAVEHHQQSELCSGTWPLTLIEIFLKSPTLHWLPPLIPVLTQILFIQIFFNSKLYPFLPEFGSQETCETMNYLTINFENSNTMRTKTWTFDNLNIYKHWQVTSAQKYTDQVKNWKW